MGDCQPSQGGQLESGAAKCMHMMHVRKCYWHAAWKYGFHQECRLWSYFVAEHWLLTFGTDNA